jgi:hypothetical protein
MDFRTEHKIKIMYSDALIGKAPPDWRPSDWSHYYSTFKTAEVTPRTFAGLIWQGYGFTPLWSNGRRKEENFVEAHHIAFDLDADGAALDVLMAEGSFAWYYASFAYATPSSTQDHPKSRVVFVFLKPVTDAAYYRRLYQAMAWLFTCPPSPDRPGWYEKLYKENDWTFANGGSYTDPACKDPLRLYYGSLKAEMVGNWSVVTPEMAEMWIGQYDRAHPVTIDDKPAMRRVEPGNGWKERKLAALCDNIANAPDGERHAARIKNAYVAGGYIAGGALPPDETEQALIKAAIQNTDNKMGAAKTIMDGINRGKAEPLYVEEAAPITGLLS